ncbi:MAG: hypothetical protein ABI874_13440, partial [Chloroflexota bacterium]
SGTHLDLRRALLWPNNSLSAAMLGYWPFSRRSVRTLVIRETLNGTHAEGFVQYRERRGQPEADIIYCAPALDKADPQKHGQHLWHKLLSQLIVRLGEHGCQRVYARLMDGAPELDLFWQLGFSAYARERVYQHEGQPNFGEAAKPSYWRPQRSRDLWAVRQLYVTVTPKLVQQAENLPQSNTLAPYRDSFGTSIDRRYVWSNNDEISGSLRCIRGHNSGWLKLMLNPHALDRADELVRDGLRLLPPHSEQVYVSVREYQSELEGAILRAGFMRIATEMLMVKHTTAPIKQTALKPLPVMEGIEARPTATTTRMTK